MPAQTPSRPIGAHVPVTGGLAAADIATLKALRGKSRAARTPAAVMR